MHVIQKKIGPKHVIGYVQVLKTADKSVFYAGSVGIISLLIMVFYSKIRNKYFQLVPAPMWIVLFSIGMYYYFEMFSTETLILPLDIIIFLQL